MINIVDQPFPNPSSAGSFFSRSWLSRGVPHLRSDRLGHGGRDDVILSRGDIHDYHGSDNAFVATVCSGRLEVTWRGEDSARAQTRSWSGLLVVFVFRCRDTSLNNFYRAI